MKIKKKKTKNTTFNHRWEHRNDEFIKPGYAMNLYVFWRRTYFVQVGTRL